MPELSLTWKRYRSDSIKHYGDLENREMKEAEYQENENIAGDFLLVSFLGYKTFLDRS